MELETTPALENAQAAPVESAPTPVDPAVTPEPAPVEGEVQEAEPSKAVKELIAQRKKRQAAEQDAAYWRGVAEGRSPKAEPAPVVPVTTEIKAPQLDDFETYEDFEVAKEEYVLARAEQRVMTKLQQEKVQQETRQVTQTFWEKVETLAESDPYLKDEIAVVGRNVNPLVADLVVKSEVGIDLVHYLSKNPQEATRISQMQPMQAAMELGKLGAQIKAAPKPEPPKRVSAAPEPIPTVTPAGNVVEDEDKLPIDQWVARRNAAAKRR